MYLQLGPMIQKNVFPKTYIVKEEAVKGSQKSHNSKWDHNLPSLHQAVLKKTSDEDHSFSRRGEK